LDRAESFLLLGGLLGVLLAGIAVGLSAHRYAQRHFDHVGVLKTLGATPAQILRGFMSLLLLVGAIAIVMGLLAGSLLHIVIVQLLASLIAVELPMPTLRPFLLGGATGLICALAFAMPCLCALKECGTHAGDSSRSWGSTAQSLAVLWRGSCRAVCCLLVWYTKDLWLTLWTLLSIVSICVIFGALGLGAA
jgi:putative ABC transport system permease protein